MVRILAKLCVIGCKMPKFVKELSRYLPQHRDVFGLKIFADSSVPKHKLEYTANVSWIAG